MDCHRYLYSRHRPLRTRNAPRSRGSCQRTEEHHMAATKRTSGTVKATKTSGAAGAAKVTASAANGSRAKPAAPVVDEAGLRDLLVALRAAADGNLSVRLPERRSSLMGQIGAAFNDLMDTNSRATKELGRVARVVGREGR